MENSNFVMMTEDQCASLRDALFAIRKKDDPRWGLFHYLVVIPGENGDRSATIHYSCGGDNVGDSEAIIDAAIISHLGQSGGNFQIGVQYHGYLRHGWPFPWGITAKDSINNFPTLVLRELNDGKVTGVLMRDPVYDQASVLLATAFVEPDDVAKGLLAMRNAKQHDPLFSMFKDSNLDADSLDEAIANTPETDPGQKHIIIYRNGEWFTGYWNNLESGRRSGPAYSLSSISDFHGTPVSKQKLASRSGMDVVREKQTLAGDWEVLDRAIALMRSVGNVKSDCFEDNPAVKLLCNWWNERAPENLSSAATFRVYYWNEEDRIFLPGDTEEPAVQAVHMADEDLCYALFEDGARAPVVIIFYRGRESNTIGGHGVQTYHVNGKEAWSIGLNLNEVDEAFYGFAGLRTLDRCEV